MLTQFHAKPDELKAFVLDVVADTKPYIALITFPPFNVHLVDESEITKMDITDGSRRSFVFFLDCPDVTAPNKNVFLDRNPGALILNVGRILSDQLEESSLGIKTKDEEAFAFAKIVFKKLKKITKAGASAINPDTGAKSSLRSHRYTEGAKELDESGIQMLPVAGGCIIKLEAI